jgi:hypothetical protein
MNRKLFFLLVILLLAVSACDLGSSEEDFEAPEEPQVRLASSETSVDGETVVTCLPQGRDNVVCELGSDAMPAQSLALTEGSEAISVEIGDELGDPTVIEIQSRESNASGDPVVATTVRSGESFTLDLSDGFYVLDVTARYDDVEGQGASVTTAFAVTVGQGVAVGSTPVPEDNDATATADVEPTETEQPEEDTPEPDTDTPTPSDEEPTLNPTELTATFIVESFAETETAAVESVGTTETPSDVEPTDTEPDVTATLTEEPTVVEPTDTDTPTDEPTSVPTDEPPAATPTFTPFQPEATATPVASDTPEEVVEATPTFTPFVPTEAPPDTVEPTEIPPTATVEEASPIPPASPTPGEIDLPDGAPEISVAVSGLHYGPVSVEFCQEDDCDVATLPSRQIQARPNNAVVVQVPGTRPQSMRYAILNRSTFDPVFEGTRGSSNVYLFNVSVPNAGLYIIEIELIYEENISVTYLYQLQVR